MGSVIQYHVATEEPETSLQQKYQKYPEYKARRVELVKSIESQGSLRHQTTSSTEVSSMFSIQRPNSLISSNVSYNKSEHGISKTILILSHTAWSGQLFQHD